MMMYILEINYLYFFSVKINKKEKVVNVFTTNKKFTLSFIIIFTERLY